MTTHALVLPPLRRKIRSRFLGIIAMYAIFGLLLMIGLFKESGLTPKLLHMNYDSIAAASEMKEAWLSLRLPSESGADKRQKWTAQFEKALHFQESNCTETSELETTREIASLWRDSTQGANATSATSTRIVELLSHLISINQAGMFRYADQSDHIARRTSLVAIAFFLISLVVCLLWADSLALRLARPLKDIAETLRTKPAFGKKLHLPTADSLEMRVLVLELQGLWNRLSELSRLNVEELSIQRTQLNTVLASIDDAMLVLDNEERIIHCNPGMAALLMLDAEQLRGQHWNDLPTTREIYLILREALKPGATQDAVLELQRKGAAAYYSSRHRPIVSEQGQRIGTVYLLHDITEKRQRDRLKAEFIGVLSHELKTPLQSLSTASEIMLSKREVLDEDGRMLVDTIFEDVARIRGVANDFMQVGLTESPSLKLKLQPVDLKMLLRGWVNPFAIVARDRGVKIEIEAEFDGAANVSIDTVKFPWVVSNLLSNSLRVAPEDSTITVRLRHDANEIVTEVIDEGPGVPESIRRRMFEPFFQGDAASQSGYLGLGLTIAREVVEAHQGHIEYETNSPKGAIFRVILPENTAAGVKT